jgi:hypothetical protein
MTDDERLEAVLGAVSSALVVHHDDEVILDLERLSAELGEAGIATTATTNRGALTAELSYIREERRVMAARRDNAEGYDRQEFADLVSRIDAREEEIQALLWK